MSTASIDQIAPGDCQPLRLMLALKPSDSKETLYQFRKLSMKSKGPATRMIFSPRPNFWNCSWMFVLIRGSFGGDRPRQSTPGRFRK